MTTTDEWEAGILAKLGRAFDLRDELKEQQMHLRTVRGTTRDYESRSNASDEASPQLHMEWRLTAAPSPLPLSFAALLGDVIQNLRAALDYAAWAGATQEARREHGLAQVEGAPVVLAHSAHSPQSVSVVWSRARPLFTSSAAASQ